MLFFADFSNPGMRAEIPRIREVTNLVIETQNTSPHYKKDFTDFIMLDYIYRTAMTAKKADTFILFTGDGHFSTAVRFLTNECKKKVVVYGVVNAMSNQLRACATECYEVPTETELFEKIYKMIIENFNYIYSHPEMKIIPTYKSIIEAVSKKYERDQSEIENALKQMIDKNYVYQELQYIDRHKKVKVMKPNWELLKRDGYSIK